MTKNRLEAFSDGVIAIIITVMVLELKSPQDASVAALQRVAPEFAGYVLSYIVLAIYWNNHHHLMHSVERISGDVMWANMHLLFWLSLLPFGTRWARDTGFAGIPVAAYGLIFLMAAISYLMLTLALVRANGADSAVARALGRDVKGKASILIYAMGVGLALPAPYVACALYAAVAMMWFVPDRRFVRKHG